MAHRLFLKSPRLGLMRERRFVSPTKSPLGMKIDWIRMDITNIIFIFIFVFKYGVGYGGTATVLLLPPKR